MADLRLISEQDFRSSRYGQIADQIEGRLSDLIAQAETYIESRLDRRLKRETYTETHYPKHEHIFVRHRPMLSLTSVRRRTDHHDAWTTLDLAGFVVEPAGAAGVIVALHDTDIANYELEVVYEAGYDPIPADIKAAVILQTVLFSYQDLEVYGAGDGKEPAIYHLHRQADRLLAPYKKVQIR